MYPAIYHQEPTGPEGALECDGVTVYCSEACREADRANILEPCIDGTDEPTADGQVCDRCGKVL